MQYLLAPQQPQGSQALAVHPSLSHLTIALSHPVTYPAWLGFRYSKSQRLAPGDREALLQTTQMFAQEIIAIACEGVVRLISDDR